ncbi:MAG: YjgP/YjgQ family permease [Candidatus Cloacimonetes bacterium]|nr:YjgP/YjgQ family permease [Candidatus Cloacimonadota bacterium]OQB07649.1 MAG: putative permease YjgP/YjgQ family protein [Candidatus Cloacimonetes bacterium ADurb.Bin211]HOD60194.1 LptF/LptG family permease [Candidatus Syntrophosphaera sp.]
MKILPRYILKEHLSPFFLSLLVVTFVLFIDRAIDLMNTIIEKKLDIGTVLQLFGLSLPYMLSLSIPMAVLVATILTFGKLTVDRETIAMKASGINIYSLLGPLFIAAILLTGLMVYFNHYFLPNTNHKLKNLTVKIAYYRPMTIIKPKEFTTISDYTIYTEENLNDELKNVLVYDRTQANFPRIITAQKGRVIQMDKGNSLQVILLNGEMHNTNEQEKGKYQVTKFETFTVNIRDLTTGMDFGESGYRSDREMTYNQLVTSIKDRKQELINQKLEITNLQKKLEELQKQPDDYAKSVETRRLSIMKSMSEDQYREILENLRSLQVEYHKKFALAFAIIIFIMMGVPIGLMTRSSGIGMAFSVSSVIFLVYYIALTGGEQLADRALLSPFLSMWITNIVFFIIGLVLIHLSIHEKQLINLNLLQWKLSHRKAKLEEAPDEIIH